MVYSYAWPRNCGIYEEIPVSFGFDREIEPFMKNVIVGRPEWALQGTYQPAAGPRCHYFGILPDNLRSSPFSRILPSAIPAAMGKILGRAATNNNMKTTSTIVNRESRFFRFSNCGYAKQRTDSIKPTRISTPEKVWLFGPSWSNKAIPAVKARIATNNKTVR